MDSVLKPVRRKKGRKYVWAVTILLLLLAGSFLAFQFAGFINPPFSLNWLDRRPIGSIFLSRNDTGWADNPRGWFNDPDLNVTTAQGREKLKADLLALADESVTLLKKMNAQGAIVWDIEGQQFPAPNASYVGDPSQLARVAPEMNAIADALFSRLRSAGFRVGVTIRPQRLVFAANGAFHQEEFFLDQGAIVRELQRKITYARNRWKCDLFYIDSNFGPLNLGLYRASIFQKLHVLNPDILLIPEHENRPYFACSAPYYKWHDQVKWPGIRVLSSDVLDAYPKAFSVIDTVDSDISRNSAQFRALVRKGNILLYRTWWNSPEFKGVQAAYQ